jgi:hypothetical protein
MSWEAPLRKIAGLLLVLGLAVLAPAAALGAGSKAVKLDPSIAGSTLAVHFQAAPRSSCAFQLGSGKGAVDLPKGKAGSHGRGVITSKLDSGTAAGRRTVSATCAHNGRQQHASAFVQVPEDLGGKTNALATALNVLLDLLLGGSLLLFGYLLIDMVVRASDPTEKLMRSLSLVGGAVIALGAEASGVSLASFTVDTLTGARPGGEAFKTLAVIVPGGIAAAFSWYFVRVMRRSADMGLRLMSFLGMLTVVTFAVVFAQATDTKGVILGSAAIPNASFVAGLIFGVVVFTPTAADDAHKGKRFSGLRNLWKRHAPQRAAAFVGGREEPPAAASAATRNPFADD